MPDSLHNFKYDDFQQRAIDVIDRGSSLLVSAPTGAGKTVLADYVIEKALQSKQRVIYTAPIKALSNQKFRDFSKRYEGSIGIMTGDVTINSHAPLVIMTTEIYRNALLEEKRRFQEYSWIIFDEVHYLDDFGRGTVWEESILFTPEHIDMLCLSATVPNIEQIAQWIREIHQREVEVIIEEKRPVPLHPLFQCQNKIIETTHQLKRFGYQGVDDWNTVRRRKRGIHFNNRSNRLPNLVEHIQNHERLPCILFTFGRRRAEDLAWEVSGFDMISWEEQQELRTLFNKLCKQFQVTDDPSIEPLSRLIDHGVAYHHAGMLPSTKEIIERCFTSRLIKLIVTTETFALGINMPARSVVLDSLKKRTDHGFALLKRREFLQMAGRAGRRGMDDEGFVYLRVNPRHISHPDVEHLLSAEPEPVRSRFNLGYATLLNLYKVHGEALLDLFPKTLFYYQSNSSKRKRGLDLIERKLQLLRSLEHIDEQGLTSKGEFASWVYGYELLLSELHHQGILTPLNPYSLAQLLLALIYEPRPGLRPSRSNKFAKRLKRLTKEPLTLVQQEERRVQITPLAKSPCFDLSTALDAWMRKVAFSELLHFADVDEGEIVRNFRMTLQLLRQLGDSPACEPQLRESAQKAFYLINRDVVDAEAQLRMGQD